MVDDPARTRAVGDDVWIVTDAAGFVQDCSPAAVRLVGYTARGARGRELPNMFVSHRPRLNELLSAAQGITIERHAAFRPNDRKALPVHFRVERGEVLPDGQITLRWTFAVRWPVGMRLPHGVDRRQLITVWRSESMRCVFVPGGKDKRRLLVCGEDDEVVHEEEALTPREAFARAAELHTLVDTGNAPQTSRTAPSDPDKTNPEQSEAAEHPASVLNASRAAARAPDMPSRRRESSAAAGSPVSESDRS